MSSTTKYYAVLFKRCINYYYFHVFSPCLRVCTRACVFMDVYVSSLGLAQAGFKLGALFLHQLT